MKRFKKGLALFGALVMLVSTLIIAVPAAAASSVPWDVMGTRFESAVQALFEVGVATGVDGRFYPARTISRAEVAAMMVRAFGKEEIARMMKGVTKFDDVSADYWASGYIAVAADLGLVSGKSTTIFAPNDNVTYSELCAILVRALGRQSEADQKGGWPIGYIEVARGLGLLSGVEFGKDVMTPRGDVAIMVKAAIFDTRDSEGLSLVDRYLQGKGGDTLARIEVSPAQAYTPVGTELKLTAKGFTGSGKEIAVTPQWKVKSGYAVISAQGTLVPTSAGRIEVEASVGGLKGTAVIMAPGAAAKIVLSTDNASLVANGVSKTTLVAAITDGQGIAVSGGSYPIFFTVSDPAYGSISPSTVYSVDGVAKAEFTVKSVSGTLRVTASCAGLLPGETTLSLNAPRATSIALTANPSRLASDGISRGTIKASLQDNAGIDMVNSTGGTIRVTLASTNPSLGTLLYGYVDIFPGLSSGTVQFTAASGGGGSTTIVGTASNSLAVLPLTITTGPVGTAHHLTIQTPITNVAADGTAEMTIRVEINDANGNVITADSQNFAILAIRKGAANLVNSMAVFQNGVATFKAKSTAAGVVEFEAYALNGGLGTGVASASFLAGQPSYVSIEVEPGTTIGADAKSIAWLVAKIRDARGNVVTTASNTVNFVKTSSNGATNPTGALTANAVNGEARISVRSTATVGNDRYQATSPGLVSSTEATISTIIIGAGNKLQVLPVASVTAGQSMQVKVKVLDSRGSLVTGDEGRPIRLIVAEGTATANSPQTTVGGVATFQVTSSTAGVVRFWAESSGLTADYAGQTATFLTGAPDHIILKATPASLAADGVSYSTITAQLVDASGNTVNSYEQLTVQANTSQFGTLNSSLLMTGQVSSVRFTAGRTTGRTTISGSSSRYPIIPVDITTSIVGAPARVVIEQPAAVTAGSGETGSSMTVLVKIVDGAGNLVSSLNTGTDLSSAGVNIYGATGTTRISKGDDYGLSVTGFSSNGVNSGSARFASGMATLFFTDTNAETVTFSPIAVYKGQQLPTVTAQGTINPGRPSTIRVTVSKNVVNADASTTSTVTASITDINGNIVKTATDAIVFQPNTTNYLDINGETRVPTTNGQASLTLKARAGAVGSTTILVYSPIYAPTGTVVTVAADRIPLKPTIAAWDQNMSDHEINRADLSARVIVNAQTHTSTLTVAVYVNGLQVPLYSLPGGSERLSILAGGSNTLVGYVNKADLGADGLKEFRAVVMNDLGASEASDSSYATLDTTH